VSANVSDHLARTAVDEAVRTTEAVVRGYVDPLVSANGLSTAVDTSGAIDAQLGRLVAAGKILRIKIWAPDGTVVFSDLAALRGRQFPVGSELTEALEGNVATDFSSGTDEENVFERGLADRFLSVYLPIRVPGTSVVAGVYEIYEDAGPIEASIATTRQDVLLIVGAMALALLVLCLRLSPERPASSPARTVSCAGAKSAFGRSSRTRSTSTWSSGPMERSLPRAQRPSAFWGCAPMSG